MKKSALILAAGMPRSGSTWLYNAARLIIMDSPDRAEQLGAGWIGDWKSLEKKPIMLIKLHDYHPSFVKRASCILYSYRDVRDSLASGVRKFNIEPTIGVVDHYISEHENWMARADFVMRYESMVESRAGTVARLAKVLGFDVDPEKTLENIDRLHYKNEGKKNSAFHESNLLHDGHITDGRHGSWRGWINMDLIQRIELKHKKWLEKHGYDEMQRH